MGCRMWQGAEGLAVLVGDTEELRRPDKVEAEGLTC